MRDSKRSFNFPSFNLDCSHRRIGKAITVATENNATSANGFIIMAKNVVMEKG